LAAERSGVAINGGSTGADVLMDGLIAFAECRRNHRGASGRRMVGAQEASQANDFKMLDQGEGETVPLIGIGYFRQRPHPRAMRRLELIGNRRHYWA